MTSMAAVDSTLFGLLSGKTRWLTQRHALLAQNVANADTPDYRPRDLRQAGFEQLMREASAGGPGLRLATTSASHLAGGSSASADMDERRVDGFETSPSGNAVVLPEQMEKMADTQLDYELTTNLYRRYVQLMKTALGNGQA